MKPFVRTKIINGHEYLYEITPYYDPKKKKIRQKSKYLGKNIDGVPIKVRSQELAPKKALSYGEFIPIMNIINELKLDVTLSEIIPENQVWPLLTLAMNYVTKHSASRHIQSWYEGTILVEEHSDLPLSSQSISNFLSTVGDNSRHFEFSSRLIQRISTSNTLIYNITSLSSYSNNINLLECSYNRDGLSHPQVNLSLIVDKNFGIPVMYDIHPGSIVDVSALKNTIEKIRSYGIRDFNLIMDRGFFSTANMEELIANDLSFIIPPSLTLKSMKQAISAIHANIDNPDYLRLYQKNPLFVMPVTIDIGELHINGYAYYDQKREQHEREIFHRKLYDLVERLKTIDLRQRMNPNVVFKEITKSYARYVNCEVKNGRFEVSLKKNAISQRVNRMGKFILLYRGHLSWDECLSLYRSKDIVEKGFYMLKNDIEVMPMHIRKDSTLKGYVFVCFLALIIRMRLMRMMKDTEPNKKYSVEGMFTELEKIKMIILPDGKRIVTECTKRQRDILNALNLCA